MTKFGSLLGLKAGVAAAKALGRPQERADSVVDFDEELFGPIVTQLGEANEAVRNLLVDAGSKIGELDAIKQAFDKLIEPVTNTLRAFEEEKTRKINLQTLLNEMRAANGKLRAEAADLGKKTAALDGECIRLRQDLAALQQGLRAAEQAKSEQAAEIAARRAQIADLERRLAQETKERDAAREESRRLSERLVAADKRIVQLESDSHTARQKLLLADQEKASLQAALDQSYDESARTSRRLLEAENALAAAQTRMRQIETNYAEANGERIRLTAALEEANERHHNESNVQRMRFETLQTRATTTDKLLDEARDMLMARAEEIRAYERRMVEATLVRTAVENKLSEIESAYNGREIQYDDLEQAHATLVEHVAVLAKTLKGRENALARGEEQIQRLNDRIAFLEDERKSSQLAVEKQFEEFNATLQRERLERAVAEGALEAARKDLARLRREMAAQHMRGSAAGDYEPLPLPEYVNAA